MIALLISSCIAAATTMSSQQQLSSFAFRGPVASALEQLPSPLAQNYTECLSAHNAERSAVGVPLLVWDQNLAQSALQWSIREAQVGQFQFQNNGLGVNNYAATGVQPGNPIIGCVPAVKLWVQQGKPYYVPGSPITQQNYQRVGGFTQVVWSRSVSVGCGTSINPQSAMAFTVCYYSPAGNVLGQAAFDSGIVIPPDSVSLN